MNNKDQPMLANIQWVPNFRSLSQRFSGLIIAMGCLVLVGWMLDIDTLKSVIPGLATMKSMTALIFILSGLSLWAQGREKGRQIAQICTFIVMLIGLLTLGEYLFRTNIGIDQLLFRDTAAGAIHPGRMSPATALSFLLIGFGLTFLDRLPAKWFHQAPVITALAISILALIGYLYDVSSLYQLGAYASMALHTALSFALLSLGIFFARPDRGIMQTILDDNAGGQVLRRFLPVTLVLPVFLGWIGLWGQRTGFYDTAFGFAIMTISLITTMTILIWITARQLTEVDRKRKQVDDSLRASELHFRSTLDGMMEGCQILGFDWRYIYVNASAEKQNRRPTKELLGKIYMDMWPGVESTAVYAALRHCMDQRIPQHMINEFIFPDGAAGWFELSIQPVPDGIFILSSDITERKRAEQALLEREMKLAILLDILPVGISILDAENKVSYTNRALKEILDLSEEELRKGTYTNRKYLRADGSLMAVDEMARARALKEKREIANIETGVMKDDDSIVWTSVSAVPVNFRDWKVVLVTSDVTERKEREAETRKVEERFSVAFRASPAGLTITTLADGKFVDVNESYLHLLGYDREEVIGHTAVELNMLSAEERARPVHRLREHGRIRNIELQLQAKSGQLIDVLFSSEQIELNGAACILTIIMDVTERKQAEQKIISLNAELEEKVAQRTLELAAANQQLHELSIQDELTGLYNRRGFIVLAQEQLLLAKRNSCNLLIFYADLDGLKQINDQKGHIAGDQAIITVAHALNRTFRASDIKARLGGDEFIVLAIEHKDPGAPTLLSRLQERLAQQGLAMSVGVVAFDPQSDLSIADLIQRADAAMYKVKLSRPGRHAGTPWRDSH